MHDGFPPFNFIIDLACSSFVVRGCLFVDALLIRSAVSVCAASSCCCWAASAVSPQNNNSWESNGGLSGSLS